MQSPLLMELQLVAEDGKYSKNHPSVVFSWNTEKDNFEGLSWSEYFSAITRVSQHLLEAGVTPSTRVLVLAATSLEWDVVEKACYNIFANLVAVDLSVSPLDLMDIINEQQIEFAVVDGVGLSHLQQIEKEYSLRLRRIFHQDDLRTLTLRSPRADGLPFPMIHPQLDKTMADRPATMVFTSGTSGRMKAVTYSQNQLLNACQQILHHDGGFGQKHRVLAWLPMAPLFQRVVNMSGLFIGSQIYFFSLPNEVMRALKKVRPTLFAAVPRFYEKLQKNLNKSLPRWLIGGETLRALINRAYLRRLFDRNVILLSGSAALCRSTGLFFANHGMPIFEAYGFTECLLPVAINSPSKHKPGTVGRPLKGNQVSFDSDNQILVRGPLLAAGYVNGHNERWRSDGYFETGDLGSLDNDGFLTLRGRKSFLLKLSTGKKIMRESIEQQFSFSENVDHFCLVGNNRPFLVALISVKQWPPPKEGWMRRLENYIEEFNKQRPKHEQIARWIILDHPFSVEGGELTGNLKLRYGFIENKYSTQIDTMYERTSA